MARFVIEGSADVGSLPDADGHAYRLLRDGVKVAGGPYSVCRDAVFYFGKDGQDTLDPGGVLGEAPIEDERRHYVDCAVACGFTVDEYGRINGQFRA